MAQEIPALLEAVAIVRLLTLGFAWRYRYLLFYLSADLLQSVGLSFLDNHTRAYAIAWASTQPIIWIVQAAVVFGAFRKVTEHYPGIGAFADKILAGCFVVAAGIAVALTLIEFPAASHPAWWYHASILTTKCVAFACAFLLVSQAAFLLLYPVPLRPNVSRHRWILTVYFVVIGLTGFFAPLVDHDIADQANNVMVLISCLCFIAWAALLTPAGEKAPPLHPTSPEDRDRVRSDYEEASRELRDIRRRALQGDIRSDS